MNEDPAKARFAVIQLLRLTGVVLTVVGALVIARRIDLPVEAGYALFFVGVVDALFMPTLLAKRWKSPPP